MNQKSPPRVLVVEDDVHIQNGVKKVFEENGFEVVGSNEGMEGIVRTVEAHPDVVVLDLMMPIKDGFAVLAKRETTKNAATPVYVLTTLGEEKCELARELGAKKTYIKSQMSATQVIEDIRKDMGL